MEINETAAAVELSAQAVVLQESVAELLALVDGAKSGPGQNAARTTPAAKVVANRPAKIAARGVVRPVILGHPAAPAISVAV